MKVGRRAPRRTLDPCQQTTRRRCWTNSGNFSQGATCPDYLLVWRETCGSRARSSSNVRTSESGSPAVVKAGAMRERALHATDDDLGVDAGAWFVSEGDALAALGSLEGNLHVRITRGATHKMGAIRASMRLGLWLSVFVVGASASL